MVVLVSPRLAVMLQTKALITWKAFLWRFQGRPDHIKDSTAPPQP
jgi:hypothetical protein